jgi:hypothetical protein
MSLLDKATKEKLIKIAKGAAIAAGGAALTYLRTAILPILPPSPAEAGFWSIVIQTARKLLTDA